VVCLLLHGGEVQFECVVDQVALVLLVVLVCLLGPTHVRGLGFLLLRLIIVGIVVGLLVVLLRVRII